MGEVSAFLEPFMTTSRTSLPLGYEYLGEQTVKNIAKPVRVYRVLMEPEAAGKVIGEKKAKPRQWQRTALIVVAILIVMAAAVSNMETLHSSYSSD